MVASKCVYNRDRRAGSQTGEAGSQTEDGKGDGEEGDLVEVGKATISMLEREGRSSSIKWVTKQISQNVDTIPNLHRLVFGLLAAWK